MGGHGGLNILPQKRWNVYNYENREKVRKDEEAAAKEEQLKREEVRKRDAEFRLEHLRASRGLAPLNKAEEPVKETAIEPIESESKSNHINLFEGIKIFDPVKGLENEVSSEKDGFKRKKMRKEEVQAAKVVTPDDEKYRLGYGVAGKGVKLPVVP
ncbi:Leukocyte receptor cluster member 1 [Melia azedarach]|uniref:Leukocyte receptor cluster member 1 n=1 Tax=Melia azedarach TaxID=155640 RepID=A0ACC1XZ84_MELAZ|nr:Leukocyte receptor cluster member 1 [Melia azedarach]